MGLEKLIAPTVCGASTKTVRGAVMTGPKFAVAPTPLGAVPPDQLAPVDQLPFALTFQVGTTPKPNVTSPLVYNLDRSHAPGLATDNDPLRVTPVQSKMSNVRPA